jgi:Pyruvate/2-oxoacid:ferredoxin oxidoreductase delta subunit
MEIKEVRVPSIEIDAELCKGCELCVVECPKDVIEMTSTINHMGYTVAKYKGEGCTGCAICFYACPEPSTIIVHKK